MRRTAFIGLSVGAVFVGFILTLWVTKPEDPRSGLDRLTSRRVSDYAELYDAAAAAGLIISEQMKGNVDLLSRTNDREVTVAGWLADPEGDATPLDLVVFVAGSVVAKTQTKGDRPDVTREMGLAFGTEKNVKFQVSFSCRTADQPVIVGLGKAKRYFPLVSPRCP